jgi:hypothetical protein
MTYQINLENPNMYRKRKVVLLVTAVFLVLLVCAGILFIETKTKVVRQLVDNMIYDNRNHFLPCERLPSVSEVEKVVREHQEVIHRIEAVNSGFVGIEVNPCGTGNADITFWYGTHKDRVAIERIIGGDTFFGIPYNLRNR